MIEAQTQDKFLILIPDSFKNYKFIKVLGCGSTSVVVLVEDQTSGEKFSAKIISKEDAINRDILEDINTEIEIHKVLDHPSIVKLHESFEIQDGFKKELIVMILEYCENGCLIDYLLNSKVQNEKAIKKIINDLLQALNYLHNKGIAHGDIKPDNVLLDSHLNPKLCDFGGCHTNIIEDNENQKGGTLYYLAPELFKSGPFNSLKADIYAFGILLYAVIEKKFPFIGDDDDFIIIQIIKGTLSIRSGIDKKLKKLIINCTQFDPKRRPTIDDIINDEYFTGNEVKQNCIKMENFAKINIDIIEKYEIQVYDKLMKIKQKKAKGNKKCKKTHKSKPNKNKNRIDKDDQELEIIYG